MFVCLLGLKIKKTLFPRAGLLLIWSDVVLFLFSVFVFFSDVYKAQNSVNTNEDKFSKQCQCG